MRRLPLALLSISGLLTGCPKAQSAVRLRAPDGQKVLKLLSQARVQAGAPLEKRADLLALDGDGVSVPAVVAAGTVGPLSRHGATVKLYGDEAGQEGWSVDRFLLIEATDARGQVIDRSVVGFQRGLMRGAEQVDSLGDMKPSFGPGEVDLSSRLPPDEPVTIKVTALETGEAGEVSDLYLILAAEKAVDGSDEELKDK